MANDVKFVRIRGRIVPIRRKDGGIDMRTKASSSPKGGGVMRKSDHTKAFRAALSQSKLNLSEKQRNKLGFRSGLAMGGFAAVMGAPLAVIPKFRGIYAVGVAAATALGAYAGKTGNYVNNNKFRKVYGKTLAKQYDKRSKK